MDSDRIKKLDDILGGSLLASDNGSSRIYSIKNDGEKVIAYGYVKSFSKESLFHNTTIEYTKDGLIAGSCDCESFQYRGFPCKHVAELYKIRLAQGRPLIKSYDGSVSINSIVLDEKSIKLEISGTVMDKLLGKTFNVSIDYIPFHLIYGQCGCDSASTYCPHMLKIRDVYLANKKKKFDK
ncbi:MAG: SWIM zinc finger family protein [Nitrososphaerota archaeon]|nr:SWIM zinc finger family protein [Nitrososphaerota archaeon]